MTPGEQYRLYRQDHTVDPVPAGAGFICRHDGISVHRNSTGGGWRHHEDQVREARAVAMPVRWPTRFARWPE